jgi:hypothetical protein
MSDEKWDDDLSHEMEHVLKKMVTAYFSHSRAEEHYSTACITCVMCQECSNASCAISEICACNLHRFSRWQPAVSNDPTE